MHTIDIILSIVFLVAMIWGFKSGFISMLLAWIGLFTSLLMIARFAPMVKEGIMIKYPIGDLFASIIACILILALIALLIGILKILFNYLAKTLNLTFINRIFGMIFGFVNMAIVLIILVFLFNLQPFFTVYKNKLNESVAISETNKVIDFIKAKIDE